VDVRVVAATNRDLQAEIRAGRFRADLFHRLAVVEVRVPPLRERREDIPLLVEHIVARLAADRGRPTPRLSPEAQAALQAHDWPGNVRELRNVLERALAIAGDADRIDARVFGLTGAGAGQAGLGQGVDAADGAPGVSFKEAKERLVGAWEREYLGELLRKADGNVTLAARRAGLARGYLHALLNKHGLARE
jgi:DNA-binding NtrC family response regulator